MSTRMMYSSIGAWFAIVAAIAGVGVLSGMSITIGIAGLVLAAGLVPATILLKVRGGAPPQTVADLLHVVDRDA